MNFMDTDTMTDRAVAADWFGGTAEERAAFQEWIARTLPEVVSGRSIYDNVTFATYAASEEWQDDAAEAYSERTGQ